MQERMDRAKVKFRQLTGKNIDLLDSSYPITPLEDVVGDKAGAKPAGKRSEKTIK
jgi:hypothetical protein